MICVPRALVAFVFAAVAGIATALGQPYGTLPQSLTQLTIARRHYDGGGDWYADPTALPNLIEFCNQNLNTNISPEPSATIRALIFTLPKPVPLDAIFPTA